MVTYSQLIRGLTDFIDNEIVNKITGYQKWIFGTMTGVALSKSTNLFNKFKDNDLIKTLEIIDKDNNIDIDVLYTELKKQASRGAITFEVPLLGNLTLTESDVDKAYNYIKKGM